MFTARPLAAVALASAMALATSSPALAHDRDPGSASTSRYTQVNLVSDVPGLAPVTDPNLVNAWGLTQGPTSPIWVSDNGTDRSTLYRSGPPGTIVPLVVSIEGGAPTGTVFNGTSGFVLSANGISAAARFLFAGENGDITAWNPTVTGTTADRVAHTAGAVYKGLALVPDPTAPRLLAANFHDNRIDVFDSAFMPVRDRHAFRSIGIPHGSPRSTSRSSATRSSSATPGRIAIGRTTSRAQATASSTCMTRTAGSSSTSCGAGCSTPRGAWPSRRPVSAR